MSQLGCESAAARADTPGQLAGHQLATNEKRGFALPWYRGELLHLAHDLGRRLLPAFNTPTGIPYARIHLQHGVRKMETFETCSAGAGSLLLEFAALSRETGDPSFEEAARKAFYGVWNSKSPISLIGNTLSAHDGRWMHPVSSTGAGVDSIFEYAAKAYLMLGEDEWFRVWDEMYSSIMRYIRAPDGFWVSHAAKLRRRSCLENSMLFRCSIAASTCLLDNWRQSTSIRCLPSFPASRSSWATSRQPSSRTQCTPFNGSAIRVCPNCLTSIAGKRYH